MNSAGKRVFVRDIGQQHVLEDLGMIHTLADCLQETPLRPWMAGARKHVADTGRVPALAQCGCAGPVPDPGLDCESVPPPTEIPT